MVALVDADVFAFRDQVFLGLADLGRDDDLAFALGVLAVRDTSVDLRDNGKVLRFTGFEQFGDTRQTTGDVLCLGCFAPYLGNDITSADHGIIMDIDVGAGRQEVTSDRAATISAGILEGDPGTLVAVLRFDD